MQCDHPASFVCNGVSVLVNGKAAPVTMVFTGEVHFQVPFALTGIGATIQVTNQVGGLMLQSEPFEAAVAPIAPSIIINGGGSSGVGLFDLVGGPAITASNPVKPGATVIGYGTGFGATNPVVADGNAPASPAPVVAKVSVTVGGENAPVLFAAMTWPGQYQVNFTLPTDLASGYLPVVMNVGGVNTQAGVTIPVGGPFSVITGVSNNASGALIVASGSWVSIYGSNLSSTTRPWQMSDFAGSSLPLSLDGVSVTIDGKAAAVSYVSPTQINVQVPSDAAAGAVPVVLTNGTDVPGSGTATLATYAPGFFQGPKYVAAVHLDGTYIAPVGYYGSGLNSRPATPGETVELYGTGFGPTTPAVQEGAIPPLQRP